MAPASPQVSVKPKPQGCAGCPAEKLGKSFVPGRGPPNAKLALYGQGPGEVEAYAGVPFVGVAPAGRHLDRWMQRAELNRTGVWLSNIVWCWLPGNRKPTRPEIRHCWRAHIAKELRGLGSVNTLVPVGVPAMEVFIGGKVGERSAGSIYRRSIEGIIRRICGDTQGSDS